MKTILKHPGVESVERTTDDVIDYKYEVVLRPGWVWTYGRNAGGRYLFINTVKDFLIAEPRLVAEPRNIGA